MIQMPFHMHINLELMECVYLTSACMLIEVPYLAQTAHEDRSKGQHKLALTDCDYELKFSHIIESSVILRFVC